jgi:hypothetical protein
MRTRYPVAIAAASPRRGGILLSRSR